MDSLTVKEEYEEHSNMTTPPPNFTDSARGSMECALTSSTGAPQEVIIQKTPNMASRVEASFGTREGSVDMTSNYSDSNSTSVLSISDFTEPSWQSGQSPDDQPVQKAPQTKKRQRQGSSDPDYIDSEHEKEAGETRAKKIQKLGSIEAKLEGKSRELATEKGRNRNLRKKVERLTEEVRKLQAQVKKERWQKQENSKQFAKKLKAAPIVVEDESVLRQPLKMIAQKCARWAESYAIGPGSNQDLGPEKCQSILDVLKKYQAISLEGEGTIFLEDKCQEILLNAVLDHILHFEILARPFYFFEHAVDINGPKDLEADLGWMLKFTSAGGATQEASSAKWQAMLVQTLRVLHGQNEADGKITANKEQLKKWQAKSFDGLAKRLESSCAGVLKSLNPEEAKQRTKNLNGIFTTAGALSFRLWVQGYRIACQSLGHAGKVFTRASSTMEPHLTMLLDTDDTSRDGQKVQLVIKPRVDAYGTDEGANFSDCRTLAPSIGWLAPDKTKQRLLTKNIAPQLPAYDFVDTSQEPQVNSSIVPDANSNAVQNVGSALSDRFTAQVEAQSQMLAKIKVDSSHTAPIPKLSAEMAGVSSLQASSINAGLSVDPMQSHSIPGECKFLPKPLQATDEASIQQPNGSREAAINGPAHFHEQLHKHATPAVTEFQRERSPSTTPRSSSVNQDILDYGGNLNAIHGVASPIQKSQNAESDEDSTSHFPNSRSPSDENHKSQESRPN